MTPDVLAAIAARISRVDGVVAVALGGSRARERASPDSDVDLGVYYHANHPLDIPALRDAARELSGDDSADITPIGGWGPWINGGGWLTIDGQSVDVIYRNLDVLAQVVDECSAGRSRPASQAGHPHGFHTHIYLGELHHAVVLSNPAGELQRLKRRVSVYPAPLACQLMREYSWQAEFWQDVAGKSATRGDVFHLTGCLFQGVARLVQVLYARNERFFTNEKGAIAEIMTFPRRPDDLRETVERLLAHPGETTGELQGSLHVLRDLIARVNVLCAAPG